MPLKDRLLPVTLFASTMGLGGTALVYSKLVELYNFPSIILFGLKWLDSLVFLILLVNYLLKVLINADEVKKEYSHPMKLNFFAGIPISMFLLSVLWNDTAVLRDILYFTGLGFITVFTLNVATLWFRRNLELKFLNPAWFIPVVGNIIAVFTAREQWTWLWYYFSVGAVFYLLLLVMILFRLMFSDPMPAAMKPSLFIFMAPPSICFIDYIKMTDSFDAIAMIFLSISIFFTMLIISMWKTFTKIPFTPSWWAFTFPVATVSSAFLLAYEKCENSLFLVAGTAVFAALVFLVFITFVKTLSAILHNSLE